MLAKVNSSTVLGMDGYKVDIEVDLAKGLPSFTIVGLPDTAIQESRERVRAGITNSEFEFPLKKITVNLAPADIRKEGPSFDLPIAVGVLIATEQLKSDKVDDFFILGELSLTGELRRVAGVLPVAISVREEGKKGIIVPAENALEAALVQDIEVIPATSLKEVADFLSGQKGIAPVSFQIETLLESDHFPDVDFAEVKGQSHVKRAMEIAAAGGHNVLMVGPPGSGKTMLAHRLPTVLPDLDLEEALEITKIYSVAGLLPENTPLITLRPFRSPHHTSSMAGLVGGGQYPKPGEVSLSHHGVLFLDEFPEFTRSVLEVLRQPLEDHKVTISRAQTSLTYPASFTLIASMNPCPCGFYGDRLRECVCTPNKVRQYRAKISGPLLDRIDIHVEVPRLTKEEITRPCEEETSSRVKERVEKARAIQRNRLKGAGILTNSSMKPRHLKSSCQLSPVCLDFLEKAVERIGLSARAYDRILKVSRTIADLEGREMIALEDLAEAIQYRVLDRPFI